MHFWQNEIRKTTFCDLSGFFCYIASQVEQTLCLSRPGGVEARMAERAPVYDNCAPIFGVAGIHGNREDIKKKDYRTGVFLVQGKLLSGKALYGATTVPCVYVATREPKWTRGQQLHFMNDPPRPDMRRIRLPFDGMKQPKTGGKYLNPFCLVFPDKALAVCQTYDAGHGTKYAADMKLGLEFWKNVIQSGDRELHALVYVQFYKTFSLVFKMSMIELQRLPVEEVIEIYRELYEVGPQNFWRVRKYSNMRFDSGTGTGNAEVDADDDDEAAAKTARIKMRIPFSRAVSLHFTNGETADPDEEPFDDAQIDPADEPDDAEGSGLMIDDMAALINAGSKRPAPDAAASMQLAKKPRSTKISIEADGIVYMASRQPQLPVLAFDAVDSDTWLQGLVYDCLHRSFHEAKHLCVPVSYWDEVAEGAQEDAKFPVPVDINRVWRAIFQLVQTEDVLIVSSDGVQVKLGPIEEGNEAQCVDPTCTVALRWVYRMEEAVAKGIQKVMQNNADLSSTSDSLRRTSFAINKMFFGTTTYATRKLAKAQQRALVQVLMSPFTVIHGPGGTGKSMVMAMIARALRIAGYTGKFLFTQFKNDTTNQSRDCITDMLAGDCTNDEHKLWLKELMVFATLDSIALRGEGDFQVVFIEEGGMVSTEHVHKLFALLDMAKLTKIIIIGDERQLEPIKPGQPMLHIIEALPEACVLFSTGFRAKTANLVHNLMCIRRGDIEGMRFDDLDDTDNGSFFLISDDLAEFEDKSRKNPQMMTAFIKVFMDLLDLRDKDRKRYADIRGICQFRDYSRLMAMLFNRAYFKDPTDMETIRQYAIESKEGKKIEPVLYRGARAVVRQTKKKAGLFKSYVGVVTHIVDHAEGAVGPPELLGDASIPDTSKPPPQSTKFRTVILDNKVAVTVPKLRGFRTMLDLGGATTCHQMQGRSAKEVIAVMLQQPNDEDGTFQTNRFLYTAVSRAEEKCFVVAPGDQLRRMVENEDKVPPSNLPHLLRRIVDRSIFRRVKNAVDEGVKSLERVLDPESMDPDDEIDDEQLADLADAYDERTRREAAPQPRYTCETRLAPIEKGSTTKKDDAEQAVREAAQKALDEGMPPHAQPDLAVKLMMQRILCRM